jgi:2-amino-4-hydroxy-6-hydroxymethyldihydropteridine diphosphokinase
MRNLLVALGRLRDFLSALTVSSIYETRPELYEEQPSFLNACCTGATVLTPLQVLSELQDIERACGRSREGPRFGPRVLDLDLLLYGEEVIRSPQLVVPHPRMRQRSFVMVPLAEIAPGRVIPASHGDREETVAEVVSRLDTTGVRFFADVAC